MFGYIRIAKAELRIKEYEMYKAVYCSLCKNLGKHYGILSRFTLSYDFTFLALLNMSLKDGCVKIEQKRCAFNPLKKCNYCKADDLLEMPSAAAMIMTYYKLLDNIADGKGIKKLGYLCLKPILKSANKKAAKKYPQIEKIVCDYISEQTELEAAGCKEFDQIADPTAKALSQLLMLCCEDKSQQRILERIGYCLGRYIYLMDAFCDLEDDKNTGSYNVLKYKSESEIKQFTEAQVYFSINEAAKAFELLDIKKYKTILGNIIYLGLEETFKKELQNEKSL